VTELIVAITLIALPDSVNPSLILTALFLAGGPHPRRSTAVFTLAATATTFVGGLAVVLGLGDIIRVLLAVPSPAVEDAITVAVGGVLVAAGILLWTQRERAAAEIDRHRRLDRAAAWLGVGVAGVELLTAFPYFAAIALLVGADVSDPQKMLLLLLYNVVYFLPLFAIVAVCAVSGSKAERLLGPFTDWLMRRWPAVVAPLCGVLGIGLMAYGGARLVG
jgi:cytochrome c biogenesis protein CcdA